MRQRHEVFVSFSSKDRDIALRICRSLEERDIECWISARDVRPGEDFQDAIVNALEASKAMVLVFSSNANGSTEICLSSEMKLELIPVRIEDVMPTGGFRYQLTTRQWIDLLDDWSESIDRVVEAIRRYVPAREVSGLADPPGVATAPPTAPAVAGSAGPFGREEEAVTHPSSLGTPPEAPPDEKPPGGSGRRTAAIARLDWPRSPSSSPQFSRLGS